MKKTTIFSLLSLLTILQTSPMQKIISDEPLIQEIEKGDAQRVKKLLKLGANPKVQDQDGDTPLGMAIFFNAPEIVETLLKKGVNPNDSVLKGFSSLHFAAFHNSSEDIIKMLLQYGADPLAQGPQGLTPLDIAKRDGHQDVASLLEVNLAGRCILLFSQAIKESNANK